MVGGANSAGQAALSLAEDGRQVYLVVRAEGLERSMARYLRDRIERDPKIEVLLGHQVQELSGDGHLERVTVEDARTADRRQFLIVGGHSSQWEKEGEASVLEGLRSSTPEQPRYSAYRANVRIVCQPHG